MYGLVARLSVLGLQLLVLTPTEQLHHGLRLMRALYSSNTSQALEERWQRVNLTVLTWQGS